MKKILTLFAALLFAGSMVTVQADTYVVAGNNADLFGTPTWAGTKVTNTMEWDNTRSLYVKTYTATAAINDVQLKVVKNNSEWKGDFLGNNVKFDISEAGSFDVCFNYQTGVVSVEGANVVPKSMYSIYAAGNGSGNWLNGKSWKEGDAANKMTEVEMNVWEITFSNVADGSGREIKFTNGTWDVNFGGTFSSFGTATNAVSGGDNITFDISSSSDISVRLDLRNCKSDKSGAKFTIAEGALPDLHSCFAAGSSTEIFGTTWDASAAANKMTWDAVAGKYSKTYTVTKAYKSVSLKTVYDGAWYGDNGENVKFSLSGAGTFTVLFDKKTKEVTVEGAIVGPEQFDFEYVTVSGNGSSNWLHGENWSTDAAANRMTEVATDIYEITFDDLPGTECQFKFSFNGGWDYEIGGVFSAFGTATEAVYGNTAGTITFTPVEDADVTIRLDLSNFNFATKEGASFTVTQILPPPPTVKMNGNFVGASMENTAAFALAANEETASITLTLTAGDYDFKVLSGSSLHSNGYTFHRDYTGATGITGDNTNNMKLEADADGDYTFTWTYETSALSIEFPEEPTPEMVEIKFFAPRDETNKWEHIYAYSFKGSRKFLGEWPGTEITSTKEAGWYTVSVRKGSNLIFTDNAGMQTNDIEDIQAAVCYESTAIDYPTDPTAAKKVTVTANANCEVAYSIAGVKALVGGEADWAEQVSLDANNQIVFPNLAAGTYEFKITNGTWAWALGGNTHLSDEEGCGTIATEVGTGNVGFSIDHTQDVTITYYPASQKICLGAETTKSAASISVEDMTVFVGKAKSINPTYESDATTVQYEILSGSDKINIADGQITGVAEGTATVRASVAETANYLSASDEFTVTVAPLKYYLKNNWNGCDWTWQEMTASDDKFRLENVVYGGSGINYNYLEDDADAIWKEYAKIKYMDGTKAKVVAAYDTINLVLDPANDTIWAEMLNKDTVVVYTVAGNTMALFDLGWVATHPYKYTDMKKQEDGTYAWNYGGESAVLPAGDLEFKVIKSRDFANGSWPATPFAYNIQRSGEYNITIHFNPCSKDIWVDTTLIKALNIQDFTLKGSDDWATGHPLTMGEENDKALVTLSLTEGQTYEFKLVTANNKWYGDGQAFTRTNPAIRDVIEVNAGANMTLNVDKTGEYLFTYFFDSEELLIQYPAIVPAEKIAPIGGKFTINAHGDTAVFSRGNLQYNYESDAWYVAEKQYDVLGDLNLRFGDVTYTGSIDLFGWSSENSDFGKQWKYKDADFTGDFVDWGTKFADDEKEWSTLSKDEWTFLLARKDANNNKLWTMLAIGPDSLNGLALFPNDWEAPAGLTIKYGFYDLDNEADYQANSFTLEQWNQMEAAGAVFLPLAGARAGYYGNTWSGTAESTLSNALASGYDWVDNVNWMGYYWTSTPKSTNPNQIASLILPGWHNNTWQAPTFWDRERRRGQPVRLVTRIPKNDYTTIRTGLTAGNYYTLCYPKEMTAIQGGTLWSFAGKDASMAYIVEESAPFVAGRPYLIYAEADKLEAIVEGDEAAAGSNNGLYGTLVDMTNEDLLAAGADYMLKNNELRPVGDGHLNAQRAYVKLSEIQGGAPAPAPGRNIRKMPLQQEVVTGMDELNAYEAPVKIMIDGQLFIFRGEKMYNANGQLVK